MISSAIGKQSNLKRTARAKDQYMFVDVREADELEKGKIDGAVHLPLGQLIRKARHDDLTQRRILRARKFALTVQADIEEIWLCR
jgi:rhodanese-related sulfurtransferase